MSSEGHEPRLILVDGLAGSGKSTTAQRLWIHLTRNGYDSEWFHEHDPNHPIFHFSELDELPRLHRDVFLEQTIANWRELGVGADAVPIRILEGSLIQLPVGVLLSKNVSNRRIRAVVHEISGLLKGLHPTVIYLRCADAGTWFRRNSNNRGEQWIGRMASALRNTPYGKRRDLCDVTTLTEFYREQQVIVESVFAELGLRKIAISVDDTQWEDSYREMALFLNMGTLNSLALTQSELSRHVGDFRGETTGSECKIAADARSLYMRIPTSGTAIPLLPVNSVTGVFCLRGLPITVQFEYDGAEKVRRFKCEFRVPDVGLADELWRRVPAERSPSS